MLIYILPAYTCVRFDVEMQDQKLSYETISSAILTANFPTLVPPYFCTSHLADGSMEFWWRLGGVRGGGGDSAEEEELLDRSDILILIPEGIKKAGN